MKSLNRIKIAVAGGGTGGHVFPGIAVAEALSDKADIELLWIGTGRPVEKKALDKAGYHLKVLKVRPLKGSGPSALAKAMAGLPLSVAKAVFILARFKPDIVLGVGGYVAGPVLLAARLLNIPTALHEQNVIPGLANRLAAKFTRRIFVSFPKTRDFFPGKDVIVSGNPVRSELIEQAARYKRPSNGCKRILVLGGSQGARGINEMVTSALMSVWNSGHIISVMHQTGEADEELVRAKYAKADVPSDIRPFLHDIGRHLGWADLVIARAGAGTVSELAAVGRPALLIPYPHAASGHQDANADYLASAGAALVFKEGETGAVKLASAIQELLDAPERLRQMSKSAQKLGRKDAADVIAQGLLQMVDKKKEGDKAAVNLQPEQKLEKSHV